MSRASRFSKETKIRAIKEYQSGKKSKLEIAKELNSGLTTINRWIRNYESIGKTAFDEKPRNRAYSKAFKAEVIQAYLDGEGSYQELAKRYQITSDKIITH